MVRRIDRLAQAGRAVADGPQAGGDAVEGAGSRSQLELRLERLPAGHPSSPDATGEQRLDVPRAGYQERIPQFELMWSWHQERWPERSGGGDRARPGDPPGSWRGEGSQFLSPERNAEADGQIAAVRGHEKGITETLKRIEQDNIYGGTLAGLEHCLKGVDRIKEKIHDGLSKEAGATVASAAGKVWDAVRYTFQLDQDAYVRGHDDITARLESAGCRLVQRVNSWPQNAAYKGINTRWLTPGGGRFELQFHTPESLDAKQNRTHHAYDRFRSLAVSRAEKRDLQGYQVYVSAAIPWPPGAETVPDYKERT